MYSPQLWVWWLSTRVWYCHLFVLKMSGWRHTQPWFSCLCEYGVWLEGVHAWVHGYQVRVCSNEIDGVLACCWVSGATLCVPFCGIPLLVDHLLWWLVFVGCVLCENCIVDASILFFLCNFCLLSCLQFL